MRLPAGYRIRIAFLALALSAAWGCRWSLRPEAPKPLQQRITWCGRLPSAYSDSLPGDTLLAEACLRIHRFEFPGAESPFRMELREYRQPRYAFSAWRSLVSAARIGEGGVRSGEGYIRIGSRWAFIHGPYLGLTDTTAANLYPEEFKERLALAGEPVFSLPPEFEAFPLLGRLPGSEGLFPRVFLGTAWQGPIFTAGYLCQGDTAIAFRGFPQNADSLTHLLGAWKGRYESAKNGQTQGFIGEDRFGDPVILKVFPDGILGISGCFDSQLAQEYVEKMQKMRFFWHNP
jgi:hypothetical protein